MNYVETLDYLYKQLPMFQRTGPVAYKKDLTNTLALCAALQQPHQRFRSVHIAGTNGKGSVAHQIAAVMQKAGYKTGLYTSPHLKDFRERIRINGVPISEKQVVNFVAQHQTLFEDIKPSFFEMTVALAFDCFAEEQVDIAIVETGLGGRLDSTNVIQPLLSVITNIGSDHAHLLGDTPAKIAFEKAGIIKPETPVVIGLTQEETKPVFQAKAQQEQAPILFTDQMYSAHITVAEPDHLTLDIDKNDQPYLHHLNCDLAGRYQVQNILTSIAAIDQLQALGLSISTDAIKAGFSSVKTTTGLFGRWQILQESPQIICDTAHNKEGLSVVLEQLLSLPHQQLHIVLGVVDDKNLADILPLFPSEAHYYFCKPNVPRGLAVDTLATTCAEYQLLGSSHTSVEQALSEARKKAQPNDLIYVGGSTFVVAEVV